MADICFVIPVYKVPYHLLRECIESVANQTYNNIEIILVDDGSPDECGKICDEYASSDKRIHVIHKRNEGLSSARNSGILSSSSTWITFVDGDDWVDLDFAEFFMNRIGSQDICADFYMYNGYRNYSNNEVVCNPYFPDGTRFSTYIEREQLQEECCLVPTRNNGNQLFIGSGWAKVYNLRFLKEKNLFFNVVPYGEDSIFFMYSVENAAVIEYVSKSVYHYRDTEGGMVNGFRKNADVEQQIYVDELFSFADKYDKTNSFKDILYFRVFIALQRVITQKFYNNSYGKKLHERHNECKHYISKGKFGELFIHLNYRKLNKNSKIKYLLLRLGFYSLFYMSRSSYLNKNNMKSQPRNNG